MPTMDKAETAEFITLREYLTEKFDAHDRLHEAEAVAIRVASKDMERRLDSMNELRQQITNERGLYVERREYEQKHESLEQANAVQHKLLAEQIQALEKFQNRLIGGLVVFQVVTVFALHYWK